MLSLSTDWLKLPVKEPEIYTDPVAARLPVVVFVILTYFILSDASELPNQVLLPVVVYKIQD